MREQSAWLLPATPRARREEETVGAERRGPTAAAAATSKRGPCSRAPERFPQPRPPLLTQPLPALGPPQQSAGSAATEGAGSRSPELACFARSQSRRRAGAPAAAGHGDALPGAAAAAAGPAPAPGLPEGACRAGAPRPPRASSARRPGPGAASTPLPLRGLDGLPLLALADGGLGKAAQIASL